MLASFYDYETKKLLASGNEIEKVFFYDAGEILGEVECIQEHEMKKTLDSVYDGEATKIFLTSDIKKANKLNLNRKDNFLLKNPEKVYNFDKKYVLYIHVSSITFENSGEMLAADHSHEKCYLQTYKVAFPAVEFRRNKIEKELCENYTLKNNEKFGDYYGPSKEEAQIKPFNRSENELFKKLHPDQASEKGILRKWTEYETLENHTMLLTKRCYTRIEKDDYRTNCEEIAEKMTAAGVKVSYFDIERLLKAGIKIEL